MPARVARLLCHSLIDIQSSVHALEHLPRLLCALTDARLGHRDAVGTLAFV